MKKKPNLIIAIILFLVALLFFSVFFMWPFIDLVTLNLNVGVLIALPLGTIVFVPLFILSVMHLIKCTKSIKSSQL